jgi:hypothetical protein
VRDVDEQAVGPNSLLGQFYYEQYSFHVFFSVQKLFIV